MESKPPGLAPVAKVDSGWSWFPPLLHAEASVPLEHPVPRVKHAPEPDAENLMPAEHRLGTL